VTLFSADGLKRDVFVGPKGTLLQAKGVGSNNFIIEAPHEASVLVGDAVINASGSSYPLGVVEKIKSNPADPFETIRFQHPVNINDLRFVLIVPSV
jgi:cell shape-determining protein MreC